MNVIKKVFCTYFVAYIPQIIGRKINFPKKIVSGRILFPFIVGVWPFNSPGTSKHAHFNSILCFYSKWVTFKLCSLKLFIHIIQHTPTFTYFSHLTYKKREGEILAMGNKGSILDPCFFVVCRIDQKLFRIERSQDDRSSNSRTIQANLTPGGHLS